MSWDHANEALRDLLRIMHSQPPRRWRLAQAAPILLDLPQEAAVFGNPPGLFLAHPATALPADPTASTYSMGVFE